MNTEMKTEWRLVPVPATQKMSEAGMATSILTSAYEKEIDIDVMFEAMCNAAPTPQVSEPVYAYRRKGLNYFCTCARTRYEELTTKPNTYEVAIFYHAPQLVKPCERCAELEQRLHKLALDWQVKENKLATLEAENVKLLRVTRQQAEASAALLNEKQATILQQEKRIKELEAAIEHMRTAGGKDEFQKAFDAAKELL